MPRAKGGLERVRGDVTLSSLHGTARMAITGRQAASSISPNLGNEFSVGWSGFQTAFHCAIVTVPAIGPSQIQPNTGICRIHRIRVFENFNVGGVIPWC